MKTDLKHPNKYVPAGPHLPAAAQTPDQQVLRPFQIERLAQLTGIDEHKIQNQTLADLTERLKWHIDPNLLRFHPVCGRVIQIDPAGGHGKPVPSATVHIMDTDCSFMCLAPHNEPWAWLFPLRCRSEEIATATTNENGEFIAWVPRFEIDWILRWRLEKHCLPELLIAPDLHEILKSMTEQPIVDPVSLLAHDPDLIEQLGTLIGPERASHLQRAAQSALHDLNKGEAQQLLKEPVFRQPIEPPQHELHAHFLKHGPQAIHKDLGLPEGEYQIDPSYYVGPFLRPHCWIEIKEEWRPILDVPDITFRVTKDVNNDGTEETIYAESFFQVRWNADISAPITLYVV